MQSGYRRESPQDTAVKQKASEMLKCSKCESTLESKGLLDSHMKTHEDPNGKSERPIPGHDRTSNHLEDNTIFICENHGCGMGANFLRDNHRKFGIRSAVINIDSQACLRGLASSKITSKTVLKTVETLNDTARLLNFMLPFGFFLKSFMND